MKFSSPNTNVFHTTKVKASFILLLLIGSYTIVFGQYKGGNGRGDITLVKTDVNIADINLFHGGGGSGDFALVKTEYNVDDFSLFHGGIGSGDIALVKTDFNISDFSLFHGGNGRGDIALARTDFNIDDFSLFHGGNGRGDFTLTETNFNIGDCSLFKGGNGRGDFALIETNFNIGDFSLFQGGNGRGDIALVKTDLNAIDFHLFHGGNGRGDNGSSQFNLIVPICNFPDIPLLTKSDDTICIGQSATLAIAAGNLHDATHWQWYSRSCGNISIGSGDSISVSPSIPTIYYVRGEGACVANSSCASISIVTEVCGSVLNLTLLLQGFYNSAGNMVPVLLNQGIGLSSILTDSITIELHQSVYPFGIVESKKVLLNTSGTATCNLISSGMFYLAVRHRNAITTWSAQPVSISTLSNYDFTNTDSKAYGNNQVEVESNLWAFFSGDINQDENIDLGDFSLLELDINNFEFGYKATDINGDGSVDLQDVPLVELNSSQFIFSNHP